MSDGSHRLAQGTRGGSTDEQWRPEVGGAVQGGGSSTPGRVGGDKRVQRESKAASKGEIWQSNRS